MSNRGVARLNDLTDGICYDPSHLVPLPIGGRIITASGNTTDNNRPVARLGDTVLADCGHTSIIITAAPTVTTNSRGTARINDLVGSGPYDARIITASPNTNAT